MGLPPCAGWEAPPPAFLISLQNGHPFDCTYSESIAEKLFYYLWYGFFGALIVAVPLNQDGMLPSWAAATLSYALLGILGAALLWLVVRLLVWR